MFVTREMDYAVRIIRTLSIEGELPAAAIAEREHIRQAITYKVLKKLVHSNIVRSSRGAAGGYVLASPCTQLTLYDVFRAVDGRLFLNRCQDPCYLCEWESTGNAHCGTRRELCRIQNTLEAELRRHPLSKVFST